MLLRAVGINFGQLQPAAWVRMGCRAHGMMALMLALVCAGCASLPDYPVVEQPVSAHASAPPSSVKSSDNSSVESSTESSALGHSPELAPILTATGVLEGTNANHILLDAAGIVGDAGDLALVNAIRRTTTTPFTMGNRAEVLVDGPETFANLRQAIAAATRSVHVETYIFADDPLGNNFADLLIHQARRGIEVRVIVDALGSIDSSAQLFERMRAGGVLVREFRPLKSVWMWPWRYQNRDHRKLLVIDGRVAFTGGINISGTYASSSRRRPGPKLGVSQAWRDTHLRIEGPAVRLYQAMFMETWVRLQGEVGRDTSAYFPMLPQAGSDVVSAVGNDGVRIKDESIYLTYMAAITHAHRRIWMTMAYFAPPKPMMKALMAAAARGVDVHIILPGFTDSGPVFYASRHGYAQLLAQGVHLHEIRDALLHAKTSIIDDELVVIGSANLDYRSFLHNNEVTAMVFSAPLTRRMKEIFQRDLDRSVEITAAQWRKRPLSQKLQEALSNLFRYWL